MTHFHGKYHGNCALMNVGALLEFRKLDFKGLKGQLDLKGASFRRLIPKFGHYWPILATRTHLWHISMGYAMGIVP